MTAYYNEINKYAAEWLRNLIAAGHIAPGVVDTRSIEDVHPADLKDFAQCHFFAGIGGWSIALRAAGWADDRPIWTGSCPCQPFSSAGEGAGFADERHLWPAFYHLIGERRPASIAGEQVASKDADPWVDLVQADLEALGYSFGSVPFPSASVGAPHIRDRLYWVGDTDHAGLEGHAGNGRAARRKGSKRPVAAAGVPVRLADVHGDGFAAPAGAGLPDAEHHPEPRGGADGLADADRLAGRQGCAIDGGGDTGGDAQPGAGFGGGGGADGGRPGPANGYWSDADWLLCRDAKWRPVEAGTFPLADGLPAGMGSVRPGLLSMAQLAGLDGSSLRLAKSYRVEALRGYGNAINPEQAAEFMRIVMECQP